jgi:hypothetical protein
VKPQAQGNQQPSGQVNRSGIPGDGREADKTIDPGGDGQHPQADHGAQWSDTENFLQSLATHSVIPD